MINNLLKYKNYLLTLIPIALLIGGIIGYNAATSKEKDASIVELKTQNLKDNEKKEQNENEERVKVIPNQYKEMEEFTTRLLKVQKSMTNMVWKNSGYNMSAFDTDEYKSLVVEMKSYASSSVPSNYTKTPWSTEPSWEGKLLKSTSTSELKLKMAIAYYTADKKLAKVMTMNYDPATKKISNVNAFETGIGHDVTEENEIRNYDASVEIPENKSENTDENDDIDIPEPNETLKSEKNNDDSSSN